MRKERRIVCVLLVVLMLFSQNLFALAEEDTYDFSEPTGYMVDFPVGCEGLPVLSGGNQTETLSEAVVYEKIIAKKTEYPEGMSWTNDNFYAWNGGIYYGGYGCAGFAFLLSDAAFGTLPARIHYDLSKVKVGDILRINNDSHSVIALEVHEDYLIIAEGNYNSSIHWGRKIPFSQIINDPKLEIMTRYPVQENNPTPEPTPTPEPAQAEVVSAGIYLVEYGGNEVVAGVVAEVTRECNLEYRWLIYDYSTESWNIQQDWQLNNEWFSWVPPKAGDYLIHAEVRVQGQEKVVTSTIGYNHVAENDIYIKGKCQMPYTGPGGGYLIGVETNRNPDQKLQYELLILDCTLLAEGKAPWIWSSGRQTVTEGNAFWAIWQPQYGYYFTYFRVYDENGNLVDDECYGFANAY